MMLRRRKNEKYRRFYRITWIVKKAMGEILHGNSCVGVGMREEQALALNASDEEGNDNEKPEHRPISRSTGDS